MPSKILPVLAIWLLFRSARSQSTGATDPGYNCTSTQSCWPTTSEWQALNTSVDGNLFATVPWAAPCYFSSGHYDSSQCSVIADNYANTTARSSVYGACETLNWETCSGTGCALESLDPSLPPLFQTCSLGSLATYYVAVQNAEHVAATINFTREYNVRLTIKNTGHDYLGRSTAPNSLAVWTYNLQDMIYHETFTASNCPSANGKNIGEIGAGVQAAAAYTFFETYNMNVVGGNEGTVGLAGGYGQGGGHGIFGPSYGLMVDNAVEFDVVTADGKLRTINECNDPDLFWAIRGGGGGTYAVLTAYRFQLYPAIPINVFAFRASFSLLDSSSTLTTIMTAHASNQTNWSNNNVSGHAYYFPDQVEMYLVLPYNDDGSRLKSLTSDFQTFLTNYTNLDITQNNYTTYPKYSEFLALTQSIADRLTPSGDFEVIASRLMPRDLFATPSNVSALVDAVITGMETNENVLDYFSTVPTQVIMTTPANHPDTQNATGLNPAWRTALWHLVYSSGWVKGISDIISDPITTTALAALDPVKALTVGGGAYVNEAHFQEPEWEETFFGSKYDTLLEIKNQYDPTHLFDCFKCVGWRGANE
ncbi:berberine protein [Coleophoma crateriformis]|uniref:Berberine protein n=1 Tax=Coleophoma crateriformis TaxID=565419 RepID=A0A3D8RD47_9HELO|nr:berberine protein [Coleophoma crateriformis]